MPLDCRAWLRGITDTYIAGELDEFGGHCGRADDHQYHVAPLHLVDVVGASNPIGYALDGYALYRIAETDGSTVVGLDQYNGHSYKNGPYHYSSKAYPYVNGGLRGVVQVQNDAVTPQPLTTPVRPGGRSPARGQNHWVHLAWAERYSLEYTLGDRSYFINYSANETSYSFDFVDPKANSTTTRTYNKPASGPTLYSVNNTGLATGSLLESVGPRSRLSTVSPSTMLRFPDRWREPVRLT